MTSKVASKLSLTALKSMKPTYIENASVGRLPEPFKKFWREWKFQEPAPVHYIPEPGKYKRNPVTGEVSRVENIPIPLKFSPEMENMLLGGEGIIKGFTKPKPLRSRVPQWWIPVMKRSVVYSEILGVHMKALVTERLIRLIHEHHGFDNYVLKTPACDLKTLLAVKIKRKMLLTLARGDCHPDNPSKREEILQKYSKFIVPLEEAEWYGLTMKEAMIKHHLSQLQPPVPLKHQYRMELLQKLRDTELDDEKMSKEKTWLDKINPFSSKEPQSAH